MTRETTYRWVNIPGARYPVLVIRNAKIVLKDFKGRITSKNRNGDKSFCVVINDHDFARQLSAEGWNVKQFKPSDEYDKEPDYFINVAVSYRGHTPPEVAIVNDDGSLAQLDQESVGILDDTYISSSDVSINQHHWFDEKDNGAEKIKAYLRKLHVTPESSVDEFAG